MIRSGIYQIRNRINGKVWIGSSVYVKKRWWVHKKDFELGTNSPYLQHAWEKYGADSFEFTVLLWCGCHNLLMYEQRALDQFRSYESDKGYNISPTAGSRLGLRNTPEHCAKISESHKKSPLVKAAIAKAQQATRGSKRTPEQLERLSKAHLGYKRKPESIARMVATNIGRKCSEETKAKISASNRGRKRSAESRARMSDGQRGRKHTPEHIAKRAAKLIGRKRTPEQIANMVSKVTGQRRTQEQKARISAGSLAGWVRRKSQMDLVVK